MRNPVEDPKKVAASGALLILLPYAAQGVNRFFNGAHERKFAREAAQEAARKLSSPLGILSGKPDLDDGTARTQFGTSFGDGAGRGVPIQEAVDVAVPLDLAYDSWSQFEEWPGYMNRLDRVEQVDDSTVKMSAGILGVQRDFTADIVEQRPKERIEWDVAEGFDHSGVVTFHKLAPRLTRIEVSMDVHPRGILERAAREFGFTRRAVRTDLHRFKAHVEMGNESVEGWRGTIEDGEVKKKKESRPSASSRNGNRKKQRSK